MNQLEALVGSWITTGHVIDDAGNPAETITASDIYSWDARRTHLVHHVSSTIGDRLVGGTEILSSGEDGTITSYQFGLSAPVFIETVTVAGSRWTWQGEGHRCEAELSSDGSRLAAHHLRPGPDGSWLPAMDVVLHRIAAA
jgi:hypothetical protein